MNYYQKIRNIREDRDFKQYQFACEIGVKPKAYNLYENGLRSIPYDVLSRILMKLEVSLDYVLGLSNRSTYPHLQSIELHTLHKNLKLYRKKLGKSQEDMAFLLNCSQQAISDYESGKLKIPLEILEKFCRITKVSADTITGRTDTVYTIQKVPN